ncbi:MAG: hypothetical protein ACJAV2_004216 [Myxococcota bacterium]|jgi:hypothetical protein
MCATAAYGTAWRGSIITVDSSSSSTSPIEPLSVGRSSAVVADDPTGGAAPNASATHGAPTAVEGKSLRSAPQMMRTAPLPP